MIAPIWQIRRSEAQVRGVSPFQYKGDLRVIILLTHTGQEFALNCAQSIALKFLILANRYTGLRQKVEDVNTTAPLPGLN